MSFKDKIGALDGTAVNMGPANIVEDAPKFEATKSMVFNGIDEYIDLGTTAALQALLDGTNPFSIAIILKRAILGTQQSIFENLGPSPVFKGMQINISADTQPIETRDRISLAFFNNFSTSNFMNVRSTPTILPADGWVEFLVTYDGSTNASGVVWYRDGLATAPQISADMFTLNASSAESFNLGRRRSSNNLHFSGNLMHLRIWDRVLTPAEVLAAYNNGTPINPTLLDTLPNLIHFNPLGNGDTPPLARDCIGTATENTDGTMTNMDGTNIIIDVPQALQNTTALFLNGIDEYVDLGTSFNTLLDSTNPFSINFVMNYIAQNDSPILLSNRDVGPARPGFQVFVTAGTPQRMRMSLVRDSPGGDLILVKGSTVFALGARPGRDTVLVTYDGSGTAAGIQFYVNGVAETMTIEIDALVPGSTVTSSSLNIAHRSTAPANFFSGNFDSMSIYDVELSAAQAAELYNQNFVADPRLTTAAPSLIAYWPIGEGDSNPIVSDLIGGQDGTMVNMNDGNFVAEVP